MTGFFEVYVRAFAIALPVWAAAILVIGAVNAPLSGARIGIAVAVAAALFGGWYAAAVPLAQRDVFNVPPTLGDPPVILGFLLGGTAIVWALAVLTPLGCRITRATPLSVIAAFRECACPIGSLRPQLERLEAIGKDFRRYKGVHPS